MDGVWQGLLANFAIVVILVSLASHTYSWRLTWPESLRAPSLGLMFGGGAVALMALPVVWEPGVFFDLRASLLTLAGLFGGPVAGVVAALMAVAFRLLSGGVGAIPGLVSILATCAVGILGWQLTRHRMITRRDALITSAYAAIAGISGFLLLPDPVRGQVFANGALPIVCFVFASTLLSALAMRAERERVIAFSENATYRTIIDNLPDSLNVKDADGAFIAANPATARLMGAASAQDLIGRSDFDFYKPDTARIFRDYEIEAMQVEAPAATEQEFRSPNGTNVWLSTLKVPLRDESGKPVGLITHNRDISERKRLENELAVSRARLSGALTHMGEGLAMFDADGTLLFCNDRYRSSFPLTAGLRVPGANLRTILRAAGERGEQVGIEPGQVDSWIEGVMASLRVPLEQEAKLYDDRWLDVRSSPMANGGAIVVVSDITVRKQHEAELERMTDKLKVLASTDSLSGLQNRRSFDEALEREVARSNRNLTPISLVMLDIDRFKAFNDHYGHPAGDDCIRQVAAAIAADVKRPADIAARYGGEEFALILPETDEDGASQLAESLRRRIEDLDISHEGSEMAVVTVSLGIATYCSGEAERAPATLLAHADEALYRAKESGRNRVVAWQPPAQILSMIPRRA